MAKNNKKSSSKSPRKQAGIQRGIGGKTARELQDAAAAVKAQTKRHAVVCVPKPSKAAIDNDGNSIPDCLSEDCISDCSHLTPDLIPASPRGVSSISFETDGEASSASSTSDDEGPAPSEASCTQEETLGDLKKPLHAQPSQELLKDSSVPQEAAELTPDCATTSTMDVAITVTDQHATEPMPVHDKHTWELSPEAQARVEAEEGCIASGAWTFDCSDNMALAEASLAELLPVRTASNDATIEPSKCELDLLPDTAKVAAAEGDDVTLPPPDLANLDAQDFAEVDESCTGPDLWTCDFITALADAGMTLRASVAADTDHRAAVSSLLAKQAHAATTADEKITDEGALVQELTGKEERPDAHKPKGLLLAQEHETAPSAAPPCSWPVALALHACGHLQAASAHRWMQPRQLACIRLPLRLVAAAVIEATAFTAAVCQYAMSSAC